MDILPLSLVILSAVIHAFWNFIFKKSNDSVVFIFLAKIFEVILYLPLIIFLLLVEGFNNKGIIYIILTGLIHYFYWLFLSLGYNSSDLAFIYPISRASPLIITFLSYLFFKEKVTIIGFLGILLIILGIYFISTDSFSLIKFINIFKKRNSGFFYALLTLLTVSIYSLVDKMGAKYVNPIIYVYFFEVISLMPFSIYVLIKKKKYDLIKILNKEKIYIVITSLSIILSYSLIIFVMRISKLSYIVSIREVSIVFGVILGIVFLKEKYKFVRITSSLLIFIGILLISILG